MNFLNNQRYIFGKSEKKKILTSFLGTKILYNFLSYTSIINTVIYCIIGLGCFLVGYFISEEILLTSVLFYILGIISIIVGIKAFKKKKIINLKNYFFLKDINGLNSIISYLLFLGLLSFIIHLFSGNILLSSSVPLLGTSFILLFLEKYTKIDYEKIFKIDILNILLLPIVIPLGITIYIITYFISKIQKYRIYKYIITNKIRITNNALYLNKYEIIKK